MSAIHPIVTAVDLCLPSALSNMGPVLTQQDPQACAEAQRAPRLTATPGPGVPADLLAGFGAGLTQAPIQALTQAMTEGLNECTALASAAVEEAFAAKGITYLSGDWTRRNHEIPGSWSGMAAAACRSICSTAATVRPPCCRRS
jgi:hypothetical protein